MTTFFRADELEQDDQAQPLTTAGAVLNDDDEKDDGELVEDAELGNQDPA